MTKQLNSDNDMRESLATQYYSVAPLTAEEKRELKERIQLTLSQIMLADN